MNVNVYIAVTGIEFPAFSKVTGQRDVRAVD